MRSWCNNCGAWLSQANEPIYKRFPSICGPCGQAIIDREREFMKEVNGNFG